MTRQRRLPTRLCAAVAALVSISIMLIPKSAQATLNARELVTPSAATMVLTAEQQPKVLRPTLERLKRQAAVKSITLEQAVDAYIAQKAKSDPAATANWPDGPVDIPDVAIDDLSAASIQLLKGMAKAQGVSFAEAIDRHGSWPQTKKTVMQMQQGFSDSVAGIRRSADGATLWVGFKEQIPSQVVELAKTLPLRVELQGQRGYTENELRQAQDRVHAALLNDPSVAEVASYYDSQSGTIQILVVPSAAARTATQETFRASVAPLVQNPSISVNVKETQGPIGGEFDTYIRGGGDLGICTSNFNVVATWDYDLRRHGTAGHCANGNPTLAYCNHITDGGNCTTISRVAQCYPCEEGDIGMFTNGSLTLTRTFYYGTSAKAYVDAEDPGPLEGDPICKYGKKSGLDCGTVARTHYTSGVVGGLHVTDIHVGASTCDHGDSGGPVLFGSAGPSSFTAYGIVHGAGELVDGGGFNYCTVSHVSAYREAFGYRIWIRE